LACEKHAGRRPNKGWIEGSNFVDECKQFIVCNQLIHCHKSALTWWFYHRLAPHGDKTLSVLEFWKLVLRIEQTLERKNI
jgi:hypothetical protein